MAEFPAMPLWTDAYLGDTTHLTTTEHGAYLLLLIAMWRTRGKTLPNDDKLLARYSRLTAGQWARMRPIIMQFFIVEGDQITQSRLTTTANAVRQQRQSQSDNAKARWLKTKDTGNATAMPKRPFGNASKTKTNIPPKPPKGGHQNSMKNGSSFPPEFPYDHRLMFSENWSRLQAWKAKQEETT